MRPIRMTKEAMLLACLAIGAPLLTQCQAQTPQDGPAQRSPTPESIAGKVGAETVAKGLEHPWALAFLPDGRILVTERPGRLRIVEKDGQLSKPLGGVPEGGRAGPGRTARRGDRSQVRGEPAGLSLLRGARRRRGGDRGRARPARRGRARGREGDLPAAAEGGGERPLRLAPGLRARRQAVHHPGRPPGATGNRRRTSTRGSGSWSASIPTARSRTTTRSSGRAARGPEIYSYGHRSMQAAALHPETGQLWTVEHGARGGDELNHPEAGKNYGWPVITYGRDYSGASIGEGTAKEGMEQPVYYWDPVIAPSGAVWYTGDRYPGWKGSLFVGSMQPGALVRLALEDGRVTGEERYLGELGERIRDVQQGPDGFLYVVTDEDDGRVLRVVPKG